MCTGVVVRGDEHASVQWPVTEVERCFVVTTVKTQLFFVADTKESAR